MVDITHARFSSYHRLPVAEVRVQRAARAAGACEAAAEHQEAQPGVDAEAIWIPLLVAVVALVAPIFFLGAPNGSDQPPAMVAVLDK